MIRNPWVRSALWAVGGTLAAAAAVLVTGLVLAERRAQRPIAVAVQPVALPAGDAALERGRYLYASRGCADCHGADGGGRRFVDGGPDLQLAGPAIAPGRPGAPTVTARYTPADWVRTVRHGVKPDGRPVRTMPSEDYNRLTDADLGALVAYVQSLAPVAPRAAVLQLPWPARVLYGLGAIPDAADRIDHTRPPQPPVPEGVTVAHGAYVAQMCVGCHGTTLAGGRIPGAPPDWPPAPALRGEGSAMAAYADAGAFERMLRSGRRADGSVVQVMPFEALGALNAVDVRALHRALTADADPAAQVAVQNASQMAAQMAAQTTAQTAAR